MSLLSKYALGLFLTTSVLTSCKQDGTQPEKQKAASGYANLSYFAKALGTGSKAGAEVKTPAKSTNEVNTVAVTWDFATVYVEKITFTGQSNSLFDTTVVIEKKLDIFNSDALAGIVKLPAGAYRDVKVKLFCRKSLKSDYAFEFKGNFINSSGSTDSVRVGSSYPFEANLTVNNMVIDSADKYKATFSFELNKVLTGITNRMIETGAKSFTGANGRKVYSIWKGGSADEPFYNQVISNWQNVASVTVSKQ